MATVWRRVSRVQEILGRRLLHFEHARVEERAADLRLADQLSLLATVHAWQPVAESEAADLGYLLDLYLEPAADATPATVARAIHVAIRSMAVRRSTAGAPFGSTCRDQSPEIPQNST
jgi:hypothetical protein